MKKCLLLCGLISLIFSGCINITHDVQVTKPWEGHFYTVEEFKAATDNMTLEEKESIWVLSDKSLSRALKNMLK